MGSRLAKRRRREKGNRLFWGAIKKRRSAIRCPSCGNELIVNEKNVFGRRHLYIYDDGCKWRITAFDVSDFSVKYDIGAWLRDYFDEHVRLPNEGEYMVFGQKITLEKGEFVSAPPKKERKRKSDDDDEISVNELAKVLGIE